MTVICLSVIIVVCPWLEKWARTSELERKKNLMKCATRVRQMIYGVVESRKDFCSRIYFVWHKQKEVKNSGNRNIFCLSYIHCYFLMELSANSISASAIFHSAFLFMSCMSYTFLLNFYDFISVASQIIAIYNILCC